MILKKFIFSPKIIFTSYISSGDVGKGRNTECGLQHVSHQDCIKAQPCGNKSSTACAGPYKIMGDAKPLAGRISCK